MEHDTKPDFADDTPLPVAPRNSRSRPTLATGPQVRMLHVEQIAPNPHQPRKSFDDDDLRELRSSIEKYGLIQPITVRRVKTPKSGEETFELIAGERRLRAIESTGETFIAARIVEADSLLSATLALIENTHREDLNLVELARAYQTLIEEHGWTQQELADHLASTRQQVGHVLSVLKLPEELHLPAASGLLSLGHVKLLVSLERDLQLQLGQRVVRDAMSVRALNELVIEQNNGQRSPQPRRPRAAANRQSTWAEWQEKWEGALNTRVEITGSKGKFSLRVRFSDSQDLERLFEMLRRDDYQQ